MKTSVAFIIPTIELTQRARQCKISIINAHNLMEEKLKLFIVLHINEKEEVNARFVKEKHETEKNIWEIILRTNQPRGYCQTVNDAIIYAKHNYNPDWYFVINDDAKVRKDFFQTIFSLSYRSVDIMSSRVITPVKEIESYGLKYFKTGIALPNQNEATIGPNLFCGTWFGISRKAVNQQLKLYGYVLNPLYFAYAEDLELSLRVLKHGGKIFIHPEPLVTHEGSRTVRRGSSFQLYYGFRNLTTTVILHWPMRQIVQNLPYLFIGQLYIVGMLLYKKYFLTIVRMYYYFWKYRRLLWGMRKMYQQLSPRKNWMVPTYED